jgi:hypothetical protein
MDIRRENLEPYLRRAGYSDAVVSAIVPVGGGAQEQLKSYGYGRPLVVSFQSGGTSQKLVFHTMSPDPFGHDRRSDRVGAAELARDQFPHYPRHSRPVDAGVIEGNGAIVSVPIGEPFLTTTYIEGNLYAHDLGRIARAAAASEMDIARARALAEYLLELHREPLVGETAQRAYVRSIRDTIGHGECIFGLIDSYPSDDQVASPARLERLEHAAVRWRWHLKAMPERARRVHGDFHPFNILFRDGVDFGVLDASRGGIGDPADDVVCLTINYLFFALTHGDHRFERPLRSLWNVFFDVYLERCRDRALLSVVAPYFAWRTLVLVSPLWYPNIDVGVRERLLRAAERLLDGASFDPRRIEELIQ